MGMRRGGGFTLLEVLIVAAVSTVVMIAVFSIVFTAVRQDERLRVRMEMQIECTRAMKELTSLLKAAGPLDADRDGLFDPGVDYPVFSTDALVYEPKFGEAPLDHEALPRAEFPTDELLPLNPLLTAPVKISEADPTPGLRSEDYPENQASTEMVFRLPQDADMNGYPTNGAGRIEWSSDLYVLCHEARSPADWLENGNVLELRRYNSADLQDPSKPPGERRVLARWLERILIESRGPQFYQTGNYDPTLGLDQLRITMWFRRHDVSRLRERQIKLKQVSTVIFRSIDR